MSDCFEYAPQPAPPTASSGGGPSDPGFDVEVANLGCVLDGNGDSLGPVFYEPTFDAETGAFTGSILVHVPSATGIPVRPYVGPWGPCPTGAPSAPVPQVRWDCACDSGAANTVVWQKFSSTDNGLTWTLLGTFTEQYGTVPYIPVGVLVNCCDIGTAPTGKRARRTVLGVGSTVVPTGLPLVGALVESLSWSSRNATGTITDTAGTVSSFVAGEGGTWELEWIDTMTFDVTTGEVVIDWIEVY